MVVGAAPGDAIFNEALFLRGILRERGCLSDIYAERISPALARGEALPAGGYRSRAGDGLIFHYSIGSTLNMLVRARAPRLVLVYHNITPPEYFRGVNPQIAEGAEQGRAELPLFREQAELALADSEFNRLELKALGYACTAVLPLAETLSRRATPDPRVLGAMQDGGTNVLFVGRIAPNKKQDDLLRFLFAFRQFDAQARLVLVGAWGGCERYLASLRSLAASLGLSGQVVLAGHVEDAALSAYYRTARLFVCLRARGLLRAAGRGDGARCAGARLRLDRRAAYVGQRGRAGPRQALGRARRAGGCAGARRRSARAHHRRAGGPRARIQPGRGARAVRVAVGCDWAINRSAL